MIVYDLNCSAGHRFEAWFKSRAVFDSQCDSGTVVCPVCGDTKVTKAITAPYLATSGALGNDAASSGPEGEEIISQSLNAPALPPKLEEELRTVFDKVREHVEANCDYVGDRFAEEARRIHYGEQEARGIYGQATAEETAELLDEGIEVMPMPARPLKSTDA